MNVKLYLRLVMSVHILPLSNVLVRNDLPDAERENPSTTALVALPEQGDVRARTNLSHLSGKDLRRNAHLREALVDVVPHGNRARAREERPRRNAGRLHLSNRREHRCVAFDGERMGEREDVLDLGCLSRAFKTTGRGGGGWRVLFQATN